MVNQRTLDEILNSLDDSQKGNLQNLRALVKSVVPETVELIKQGKVTFKLESKDFVWINHYRDHVDLEFAMGASLDSQLLKRRGVAEENENTRHVVVGNFEKLRPELTRLLRNAASLGFDHCPTV